MIRIILVLLMLQLFKCGDNRKPIKKPGVEINVNNPSINLITLSEPQNDYMEALISGTLIVDINGCVKIEDYNIIWPYGFQVCNNNREICDSKGISMAKLNAQIKLSGGERTSIPKEEFEKHIILETDRTCEGNFWLVGEEIGMN